MPKKDTATVMKEKMDSPKNVPINGRLRYFMKIRGNLSEIDLARLTGLPQPTVHHILSGATARPHRKTLLALTKALSITIADLLDETSVEEYEELRIRGFSLLPLLTFEEATIWPKQKEQNPYFAAKTNIMSDMTVGPNAFAIRMEGSSMEPLFPAGTFIIIDPSKEAKDRNFVAVHMKNEKSVIFKQIFTDGRTHYLKSLNENFHQFEPIVLDSNDRIIGVAVQTRVDLLNEK